MQKFRSRQGRHACLIFQLFTSKSKTPFSIQDITSIVLIYLLPFPWHVGIFQNELRLRRNYEISLRYNSLQVWNTCPAASSPASCTWTPMRWRSGSSRWRGRGTSRCDRSTSPRPPWTRRTASSSIWERCHSRTVENSEVEVAWIRFHLADLYHWVLICVIYMYLIG